jgi:hypothetical protein
LLFRCFAAFAQRYASAEQAVEAWRAYCLFIVFVPVTLALLNYLSHSSLVKFQLPERARRILGSQSLLFASVAGCLVMWRYPVLLLNELNPDETQFIVAARKLFSDPMFFRSVDCGTSGPLNIYPLMLPALFGLSPDYASSRLVGIFIIFLSIYTLYRAFALLVPDHVARIAILPLSGIFSVLSYWDFLHYTSEHVALLILSLSIYSCIRLLRDSQGYRFYMCILGLLTAAALFAKMQAVPMLLAVDAVALAFVHVNCQARRFWHPAAALLAGVLPLPLINAAICVGTGQWRDFWMSYVLGNRGYIQLGLGASFASSFPDFLRYVVGTPDIRFFIFTALAMLAAYFYCAPRSALSAKTVVFLRMAALCGAVLAACTFVQGDAIDYKYLASVLIVLVPALLFLMYPHKMPKMHVRLWACVLAAALVASAFCSIYVAHRLFPHYLLLLIIPLGLAMACLLILRVEGEGMFSIGSLEDRLRLRHTRRTEVPFVLLFVSLCLAFQIHLAFVRSGPGMSGFSFATLRELGFALTSVRAAESDYIDSVTPPNGQIVVWGWNGRPYLGAGRDPATRDINMANCFRSTEAIQKYYRARFVADLRLHPAVLFIDAVGPSSCCGFARQEDVGFELVPEINAFVQSNYVYVMSAYGERFFIRRDLASHATGVGEPRQCSTYAIRCLDGAVVEGSGKFQMPFALAPVQMPDHAIIVADFIPETNQDQYATVFSNEASSGSGQGFQFQHMGNDEYRLAVGLGGGQWAFSRSIRLPQRKRAAISVELNLSMATIVCNGIRVEEMHLLHRLVDSPGAITLGSWIEGQRSFRGRIQLFEIRDLARDR